MDLPVQYCELLLRAWVANSPTVADPAITDCQRPRIGTWFDASTIPVIDMGYDTHETRTKTPVRDVFA
jgi:hypothetical protein